jgi:SAM-dependent methyltransferase
MVDARYDEVIAHYYDAGYAALPSLVADVDFYRGLAAAAAGPVLELGCGTGRVLARIAEDGHACTGLDASPGMLARLRARAPGVRAVEGDMRDFSLGGRFALIYSAFRAFQHLDAVEDQLRCLACVRAHLAPGARFAFDVFNPRLDLLSSDDESEAEDLRFAQDGEEVVRYARRVELDRAHQRLRVAFRYERRAGGRVVGNEHAEVTMRWFFRYELLHLMHRAGFAEVAIYGDFDGSPIGPDSPAFVVVAR